MASPRTTAIRCTTIGSRPGRIGFLLPWLLAPAWVFLPLGGCGLAKAVLDPRPVAAGSRTAPTSVGSVPPGPVAATMTVAAAPRSTR